MYKIYFYDIRNMGDTEYEKELKQLPMLRQKKISAKNSYDNRKLSLAGDMLARKVISHYCNVPKEKVVLDYGEHGKPYAVNLKIHFNISHSGYFTVLAISDRPVGVDVETVRTYSPTTIHRILTEEEKNYIASGEVDQSAEQRNLRFFELWTIKEAYLKLTGTGLSGGIKSLPLVFEGGMLRSKDIPLEIHLDYSVPDCITAVVQFKDQKAKL